MIGHNVEVHLQRHQDRQTYVRTPDVEPCHRMPLGPFPTSKPGSLSEAQQLSSISAYLPASRHPDEFYTLLGFSIFSPFPQTPPPSYCPFQITV